MECQYCKGENTKGRTICISCGGPLKADTEAEKPIEEVSDSTFLYVPNYLIPSIVSLVLCQPLGIVAFTYALKTIVFSNNRRYEDAKRTSRLAKKWCWISLTIGVVIFVAGIVLYILSFFGIAILSMILGSIK